MKTLAPQELFESSWDKRKMILEFDSDFTESMVIDAGHKKEPGKQQGRWKVWPSALEWLVDRFLLRAMVHSE